MDIFICLFTDLTGLVHSTDTIEAMSSEAAVAQAKALTRANLCVGFELWRDGGRVMRVIDVSSTVLDAPSFEGTS